MRHLRLKNPTPGGEIHPCTSKYPIKDRARLDYSIVEFGKSQPRDQSPADLSIQIENGNLLTKNR